MLSARTDIGITYGVGKGCEQSHERAVEWWAKAAEQGHANAQCNLGIAYQLGQGVPQSYERAVELYKLGEAQGHAGATNNLGRCHRKGWGVDHSYAEARRLFELAVARGQSVNAPGNVQSTNDAIQQHCPLLGQRVVLRGLNTAALNGTRGTAVDFGFSERDLRTGHWFTASGRCTVRLDGPEGRLVKVRVGPRTPQRSIRVCPRPRTLDTTVDAEPPLLLARCRPRTWPGDPQVTVCSTVCAGIKRQNDFFPRSDCTRACRPQLALVGGVGMKFSSIPYI